MRSPPQKTCMQERVSWLREYLELDAVGTVNTRLVMIARTLLKTKF